MRKKICGIYGFINTLDGKWYVGQSVNVEVRRLNHLTQLRRGLHHNVHFQAAFLKYGESSFEFHLLEEVPEDLLDMREQTWISYHQSIQEAFGYNSDTGGNLRKHPSEETKRRISLALKNRFFSEEHRRKISEGLRGRFVSAETRARISAANLGKTVSAEVREAVSRTHKGKIVSPETRKRMSDARKGMVFSEETRRRMSEAGKRLRPPGTPFAR